ncbi:MAG: GMC family oxidoreductase N-terminal domain-containing protein, partial [Spirochaetia bacterium]|nr:GMC family oxidoreductase N-terminal domain-containing protein [Spirochaetia bacterium]
MKSHYNVVIVGSGAGGGTAAEILSRYTQKGLSVLLVEGGPYWPKEAFTQRELEMSGIYFRRGAIFSKDMQISVAAASAVGGSTSVYTGVSFRPPASVLERWRTEFGLQFLTDEFARHTLDEIETKINVHELSASEENDNNRLFREGCEKLKIPVKKLRINTRGCKGQGFCNLGCTAGAKLGTLEVQVPEAVERGIDIVYNAWVDKIGKKEVFLTVRPAPAGTRPNTASEGPHRIEADVIVLAGGALHTPAILLRSEKDLGFSNPILGRYVTLHPAYNVNGVYTKRIKNYRGFPKLWYVDEYSDLEGYYLETSFYYPGITAKNQPLLGAELQSFMDDYRKMMSLLILIHDEPHHENRVAVDKKGETVLHYTVAPEVRSAMALALRRAAQVFFAAGCERVALPGSSKPLLVPADAERLGEYVHERHFALNRQPLSSAHPQGGARMGADP